MVEYIDREAANLALAEQGFDWDKAKQALASVPAADVVAREGTEVQTMNELKPCPFCGGKARLFVSNGVRVLCPICGATTRILVDSERVGTSAVEDVIKAWNRRGNNDEV